MKTTRKNRTARPISVPATAPTIFPADKLEEVCSVRGGALVVDIGMLSTVWLGEPKFKVLVGVNWFVLKMGLGTVYDTYLSNAICGGV
jgi:hypothetical protein